MNNYNLLINIILTVVTYLLVPIIILLRKKKYNVSTLKKIIILNGVFVWMLFTILNLLLDINAPANTSATFIWSWIGYRLLKKYALLENTTQELCLPEKNIEPTNNVKSKLPTTFRKHGFIIISAIVLFFSISLNIYQYNTHLNLQNSYNNLELEYEQQKIRIDEAENLLTDYTNKYHSLKKDHDSLIDYTADTIEKLVFYDSHIVFIIDGYGNYYYTYDEMQQVTQGIENYSFWAFNEEAAKANGYTAWQ